MSKYFSLAAAVLLAGCAIDQDRHADRKTGCPAHHTLSCDASASDGETVLAGCVCVRTSDVNSLLQRPGLGRQVFRSRIRK